MAAQGYIGRAPGESSVIVARQTFTPTGITTNFTFASGYTVGYVDAYLNGARLIEGSDYTATDGSVVGLTTHAQNGDVLELVVYKAFNLANVTGASGDFSIADKIVHTNDVDTAIRFPQADTFTVETAGSEVLRVDANGNVGIGTTNTLAVADPKNQSVLNVGVVTANSVTAAAGTFTSLNVSGTLTYDDVTNVDAVGYSTFREGINVQGAGSTTTTLNVSGVTTMTGDVNLGADFNIPDAITHVGDSNTKIRFPAADTFTVETGGSEALRIDSSGRLLLGTTTEGESTADDLTIATSGHTGITIRSGTSNEGNIFFSDGTSGSDELRGAVRYYHSNNNLTFTSDATEAFRVDSSQRLLIGTSSSRDVGQSTAGLLQVEATDATAVASITRNANSSSGPVLALGKSRGTSNGSNTVVQSGDNLGLIYFAGADGTDSQTVAGRIQCQVDATPGSNDMPGRLIFATTADGASAPTERLRIDSSGRVLVGATDTRTNVAGQTLDHVFEEVDGTLRFGLVSGTTNTSSPILALCKHRGTTSGSLTAVNSGDNTGVVMFTGSDGTNFLRSAQITSVVDGTPGTNDMPGRLEFSTTADGASTPTERLRITSNGRALLGHSVNINNKLLQITTSNGAALGLLNYQATDDGPEVTFIKSRNGTKGSHTVVNNGDFLGRIFFRGSDGDSYERGVEIAAQVDGTPGDSDMPGRLLISTTANGASTPTERLRITSTGRVSIPNDSGRFTAGAGDDLQIYHDGTDSYVDNSTGDLILRSTGDDVIIRASDDIHIQTAGSENAIVCSDNGNVALYFNGVNVFQTYNEGIKVIGDEGTSAGIRLEADQGDDNGDTWRINSNQDVNDLTISNDTSGSLVDKLTLTTGGNLTVTGTVTDSKGELRVMPKNAQASTYTLVAADHGKFIEATNTITVPASVFTAGQMVTIVNQTSGNITITQGSGLTLYNSADASTGNKTLSARGMATVLFASGTTAHISGNLS